MKSKPKFMRSSQLLRLVFSWLRVAGLNVRQCVNKFAAGGIHSRTCVPENS